MEENIAREYRYIHMMIGSSPGNEIANPGTSDCSIKAAEKVNRNQIESVEQKLFKNTF